MSDKKSSGHLRKYFLFNYDANYRTMVDYEVIGIAGYVKDLSFVYNVADQKHVLFKTLDEIGAKSNDLKDMFEKFLFEMEIGDAVCLVDNKAIWAIGIIESNYRFYPTKELPHARKVRWLSLNKIDAEDGNYRIKIRPIVKKSTYEKVEEVINAAILNEEDSSLLVNYTSRITTEEYINFFEHIQLNPHEIELFNIIYSKGKAGISVFELRKQFEGVDVDESLESLAKKISRNFRLPKVEEKYIPNLFNGVLKDGHLCLTLKNELADALIYVNMIDEHFDESNDLYSIKKATANNVYPKSWFEEALSLLELKRYLNIVGPWGTGKSYFARRLAFLLMKSRNVDNMLHIKMHKSLTYHDLLIDESQRILYKFIEKARKHSMENYVIIFEDLHEVDFGSVIGEISYLLEDNNREKEAALDVIFDDQKYYIPKNVYVISTSRDTPDLVNPDEISNALIFEMKVLFNKKFINMFEDVSFGEWVAATYTDVNKILEKYNFSINHGLFLKSDRGINLNEYSVVISYKIVPIIKRIVDEHDYKTILKKIKYQ